MRAIMIVLVAAAAGVAVFWDGGFDPVPQWTFAGAAGAAGVVALAAGRRTIRNAPVAVLLAIAGLQALSAAWTIDSTSAALRAAALTAAYAALTLAASAQPARAIAAALAAAAGVTGLMGLTSAAFFSTMYAERIEGAWRPEGPFGYPPALALVQVLALPVLVTAMTRARPALAGAAAAGAAIAAGVLVVDANRLSVGLAALVLGIALVVPERTVRGGRVVVVGSVGLLVVAGVAFHALMGDWVSRYATAGPGRAMSVLAIVVALGAAWFLIRPRLRNSLLLASRLSARRAFVGGAVVVVAALAAGLVSSGALSARRFPSHQGFTHGRSWMWSAAYRTAVKRPLYGYGAGAFYEATVSRQPGHGRVTRFAHDLPLELAVETGIAGFLLALALYVVVARSLWRARGSPELWLLGPAVAGFLVSNLVDWSWHLAGAGALFALALGGLVSARRPALRP
jgi:hypothetical protein